MNIETRSIDRHFADFISRSADRNSPLWICTALLSLATSRGDICLDLDEVADTELMLDSVTHQMPAMTTIIATLEASDAVGAPGDSRPLILTPSCRLYLHRYWQYEHQIATRIKALAANPPVCDEALLNSGLASLFNITPPEPDWQAIAAIAATNRRFCIISGGPGTGKTTTVVKIIALLLAQHQTRPLRIALTAPTGKAAARLKDSINRSRDGLVCPDQIKAAIPDTVSTLHRLLGSTRSATRFRHSADNLLPYDLVVVDEASMVDLPLMAKLLIALPSDARLILLGDRHQLASVEAGAVLGDLWGRDRHEQFSAPFCSLVLRVSQMQLPAPMLPQEQMPALSDALVMLKKTHRFSDTSTISLLAEQINRGESTAVMELLTSESADCHWQHLPVPGLLRQQLAPLVQEWFGPCLTARTAQEALNHFERFRILCCLREGRYGIAGITELVEELLSEQVKVDTRNRWYTGKPIMITVNDYTLGLYNGDIGVIFPDSQGQLAAWFPTQDSTLRRIATARLPRHETAYAITVHKSQGSEFDQLLLILPDSDSPLLTRELLYTGITRARNQVVVWGNADQITQACIKQSVRRSGLADQLWPTS